MTEEDIKKASEWIKDNAYNYIYGGNDFEYAGIDTDEMITDFEKAMKGDQQ